MKSIALLLVALLMAGCSFTPIDLSEISPNQHAAKASKIIVSDLSTEKEYSVWDDAYKNGYAEWNLGLKTRPNKAMADRLSKSIVASGAGATVTIHMLRAGLFWHKTIADDMAFVSILTALGERSYKCDVDINLSTAEMSHRETFSVERSIPGDGDVRGFFMSCQNDLVKQIADRINSL